MIFIFRSVLLPFILLPLGYLFLWPLLDRLLRRGVDPVSPLEMGLTALLCSVGLLTLALFWIGLLPGGWITGPAILVVVLAGLAAGLALNREWFAPPRWIAYWRSQWRHMAALDGQGLLLWALLGCVFVVLVYALYFPFIGDDTLARYGLQAQTLFRLHRFPPTLTGYPPLAPLAYAATWLTAGQANEHLARVFAAVMAAGTLGTAYVVGRRLLDQMGGLLAAVICAFTPMFVNNATLAYTDIPTTFPLILAIFYLLRWWESGRVQDAALSGVLIGIATFTKQSALTWVASAGIIPVVWLIATRRQQIAAGRWRRALAGMAGILVPVALFGGPWYARNVMLGGWGSMIPVSGLYFLRGSQTNWLGLIPPLAWPGDFGPALTVIYVLGWVMGLVAAARQGWQVLRGRVERVPTDLIVTAAVIPYWLAWWTRFSFDARFLLLILPLMAVWAARPLMWAAGWQAECVRLPRFVWQIGGSLLLLGMLVWGAKGRLGGIYYTLTQPFASDQSKLERTKGAMFYLVEYARSHLNPATDRLYLMDERLAYYLSDFDYKVGFPQRLSNLEGYDYLFHVSSIYSIYGDGRLGWQNSEFYKHVFDPQIFEPVYEYDGVHVMRILQTDLPN